jgi:hypothetical protein
MGCLPLIDSLIRKFNFQLYEDAEVLRNECIIKLFKAIRAITQTVGGRLVV